MVLPSNGPSFQSTVARFMASFPMPRPGRSPSRGSRLRGGGRYRILGQRRIPICPFVECLYSWHPRDRVWCPVSGLTWPPVAFEVGADCPLSRMRAKARFWLTADGSGVKAVLLVKLDKDAGTVRFELWKRPLWAFGLPVLAGEV